MYEVVYCKSHYQVRKRSNGKTLLRGTREECLAYIYAKRGKLDCNPSTYTCYSNTGKNVMGFLK